MKRIHWVIGIILLVLIIDQVSKFYIKLNFEYGEGVPMFGLSWAYLHFIENKGMAFGITLGGDLGKLLLSVFRIAAVILLWIYIIRLEKQRAHMGLLVAFGLIFAGAVGNIIDSAFYGLIFSESNYHGGVAHLVPFGQGYAGFLHGSVVDMLYFPLIDTVWPSWVPYLGGSEFQFFKPVFNVADSSITLGVSILLLFYNSFFKDKTPTDDAEAIPVIEFDPRALRTE
ncbi:MAG TPA: lipoprotein signal peptidase [Saprospiraceae bacterium]|nr:lipoprotein signal peptidase [Saprospiraceae bacterium]HQW55209.1 lipoprotein signal peptidase [Saprospiraceae bacterium]